jgi:hypothetical protein
MSNTLAGARMAQVQTVLNQLIQGANPANGQESSCAAGEEVDVTFKGKIFVVQRAPLQLRVYGVGKDNCVYGARDLLCTLTCTMRA